MKNNMPEDIITMQFQWKFCPQWVIYQYDTDLSCSKFIKNFNIAMAEHESSASPLGYRTGSITMVLVLTQ